MTSHNPTMSQCSGCLGHYKKMSVEMPEVCDLCVRKGCKVCRKVVDKQSGCIVGMAIFCHQHGPANGCGVNIAENFFKTIENYDMYNFKQILEQHPAVANAYWKVIFTFGKSV